MKNKKMYKWILVLLTLNFLVMLFFKYNLTIESFKEKYIEAKNNTIFNLGKLPPYYENINNEIYFKPCTLELLKQESEVIVKVTVLNKTQKNDLIRTEVKIEDVYLGQLSESKITIVEPYGIEKSSNGSRFIFNDILYTPLNENKEYIVFLKGLPEKNVYTYSMNSYSKYPVNETPNITYALSECEFSDIEKLDLKLTQNAPPLFIYQTNHIISNEELDSIKDIYLSIYKEIQDNLLN